MEVLGGRLGTADVRALRRRVGLASAAVADQLRPQLAAVDVVMAAKHAALETWWHTYDDADRQAAVASLDRVDGARLAGRPFGTLSSGERQRVLLARALYAEVGLLLLDEPMAGLDLGAREALVASLGRLAADPSAPALVLVTHHVEEIPPGTTHALVLCRGRVLAAGELHATLTAATLGQAFGVDLDLRRRDGRWSATARPVR